MLARLKNRALTTGVLVVALVVLAGLPAASAAGFSRVVIDPGHGGYDRGTAAGLTYEKHLALDVARRLEKILKEQGILTEMTRERDEYVSLTRRVAIASRAKRSIFVSIHFNSSSSSRASGVETFYHHSSDRSRMLAQLVQSAATYKTKFNDRGAKNARFHVLSKNKRPAVLVECGFISNRSEHARTLSPAYRQRLAEGIAMGIIRYKNGG